MENEKACTLFWRLFNETLGATFDPVGWICDAAGAMWCAIGNVFNGGKPIPSARGRRFVRLLLFYCY